MRRIEKDSERWAQTNDYTDGQASPQVKKSEISYNFDIITRAKRKTKYGPVENRVTLVDKDRLDEGDRVLASRL